LIFDLTILLLCQLAGESVAFWAGLPVPGPVIGLALLVVVLVVIGKPPGSLEQTATGLLQHLSLLFVPAGVGVVQKLDLLASHGIAIILVLALSVVVTLLATVLTFRLVSRLLRQQDAR
jgi:holin-like protein